MACGQITLSVATEQKVGDRRAIRQRRTKNGICVKMSPQQRSSFYRTLNPYQFTQFIYVRNISMEDMDKAFFYTAC